MEEASRSVERGSVDDPALSDLSASRRTDLDWLRVAAFGLLILYHSGMAWSGWNWDIASSESIGWLREGMRFLNRWRMPLVFVVSGAAIIHSLGKRSAIDFAFDRICRLLLPLAFGMVVLVPPQDYLAMVYNGQFSGSFPEFLSEALRGAYPAGKMHSHHLWFLAYVLVLTFVLLPGFLWLRSPRGRHVHAKVATAAARFGLQWLMPLPLAGAMLWMSSISGTTNGYAFVGPWYGLTYYGVLLLCGASIFASPELLAALNRQRFASLGVGIVAYAVLYVAYVKGAVRPDLSQSQLPAYTLLSAVNTMAWLFAIVGFANRHLTYQPPFLRRVTEAVLPFYLLHQTVTVIAVYWLLRLGSPPLVGYVLAVGATFIGSATIFLLLVRPVWFVRPLFGLKTPGDSKAIAPSAASGSRHFGPLAHSAHNSRFRRLQGEDGAAGQD